MEDPASPVASETILKAAEAAAESADEAHRREARVRQDEANRSEVIEDEPAVASHKLEQENLLQTGIGGNLPGVPEHHWVGLQPYKMDQHGAKMGQHGANMVVKN